MSYRVDKNKYVVNKKNFILLVRETRNGSFINYRTSDMLINV